MSMQTQSQTKKSDVVMEKISYGGWQNCIRLSNGEIELIITTDVGPRIIRFGFINGQNLLKEFEEDRGKTGGVEWRPYGGHRLWHGPEASPRCYWPDNEPVYYSWDGSTLKLVQKIEGTTGIQKEIRIYLDRNKKNHVELTHRLTNKNMWDIELAPWCLTIMAAHGRAILPQEEYRSHESYLAPARPLVLWHYTNMSDPRWTWGAKYIQLRQDPKFASKQKLGLMNSFGWMACCLKDELFLKRYGFDPKAVYTDFGSNTEIFTNDRFIEIETLGPMSKLSHGSCVEHIEHWFLYKEEVGMDEPSIDAKVLPYVKSTDSYEC